MSDNQLSAQSKHEHEDFRVMVNFIKNYAIFTLGPDGQITSWNTGAERLHGWKEHEISGKNFAFLYADEEVLSGELRFTHFSGVPKPSG